MILQQILHGVILALFLNLTFITHAVSETPNPTGKTSRFQQLQSPPSSQWRQWLDQGTEGLALFKNKLLRRYHLATGKALPGTPDLTRRKARLKALGVKLGAPVFIRLFKREAKLELWLMKGDKFVLFDSYPICRFSGRLGPKQKTGDKQAPEGFYTVSKAQLNPNSRWHRSFNLGYPNLYDRQHGRTGSFLMVHGGCSSIGCYAMTNAVITEIWDFITAALKAGQKRIHVHAFPFRLTALNMYLHGANRWAPFWRDLKAGYDLFEATHLPPRIAVCNGRYVVAEGKPSDRGATALIRGCFKSAAKH